MALKPDRSHLDSDISMFMNQTAERGGIVCVTTAGSGAAMDNAAAVVEYSSNPSGKMPVGLLTCDVVNLDLTRQHLNQYKEEVQVGGKVTLWTKCVVVTDYLTSGITVAASDKAFVANDGRITNIDGGAVATPMVGIFLSKKNEDGFAKVSINLPMARS